MRFVEAQYYKQKIKLLNILNVVLNKYCFYFISGKKLLISISSLNAMESFLEIKRLHGFILRKSVTMEALCFLECFMVSKLDH